MTKRMLIDAAHAEETRVVVVDGQRIEELDFESQSRRQLRGNIYLAKVTRVEPSLQAAFIEYGGNRHGFLAFNEVHPDYYQIPVADREALLQEEAEEEAQLGSDGGVDSADEEEMDEVVERRRRRLMRRYKIQEVIKRRQIMLVQVVKEERGNKGAALTTYLSLAGRYCVLMPNTARGGGISRKITSATDRKRLKTAVQSLEVPKGMGLIIRTAGAARTKIEIKRDYEYLTRLWENIREKTLQSIAPALIYEEEDLVKRAIRDLFDKDIESIQVEGDAGYREARDFMRMIMPSQADKVAHYREPTPLFVRHKIEDQIAQIHSPTVQLKSGGYLVINQTEALVAIDVNSGRSTRERNIETTALKTNLEAAEEAARQLRLRDLAGLIVIDFIDMEEAKNNRAVEKVLKDALKDDRARLQMGKISGFGLMEISRQRRRTGVLEGSTHICEHCQGIGRVRSVESSAVAALRSLEMESVKGGAGAVTVRLATPVGLYILNEKRAYLEELDRTRDLHVSIAIDDKLAQGEVEIERTETREGPPIVRPPPPAEDAEADWRPPADLDEDDEEEIVETDENEAVEETSQEGQDRKRRRRGRGGRREEAQPLREAASGELDVLDEDGEDDAEDVEGGEGEEPQAAGEDDGGPRRRRRRRGRRGGRRLREETRPGDVYAWVSPPRAPGVGAEGGDPYAWHDPHEARAAQQEPAPRSDGETDTFEPRRGGGEPASGARDSGREGGREGGRDRGRGRRRGRGRSGEGFGRTDAAFEDGAPLDAALETSEAAPSEPPYVEEQAPAPQLPFEPIDAAPPEAPEPMVEAAAPAKRPRRSRAKASLVVEEAPEASPAPVLESAPPAPPAPKAEEAPAYAAPMAAEPILQTPRAPDPAEISAPPETPRRGWWRRLV